MQIADRISLKSLGRVCEATKAVCALPAVATLDWCDRAAASLRAAADLSTVLFVICTVDSQGRIDDREAVGVAGVSASAPGATEDAAMTGLRSRAHRLTTAGFAPGDRAAPLIGSMDRLAPEWRLGPVGRLWGGQCRGDLIVAEAPLLEASNRTVLAHVATGASGTGAEAAAVLEVVFPLLVSRAALCLGSVESGPRGWLTLREQEVLEQLTLGKSVKEIAETLGRSPHTVHDHVKALHRKLGASTRGELIARALGHLPACIAGAGKMEAIEDASQPLTQVG